MHLFFTESSPSNLLEVSINTDSFFTDSRSTEDRSFNESIEFYVRHNITKAALYDLTKLPRYKVENKIKEKMRYSYVYHVKCTNCGTYISIENGTKAAHCERALILQETNFFATIPVKQQLINSIGRNFKEIMEFLCEAEREKQHFGDIFDGQIYKNIKKEVALRRIILPLSLNSDGIKMFKRNVNSVWPIQLIQNFLPPRLRYLTENIILSGIFYGTEIDFKIVLKPLIMEMEILKSGFDMTVDNVTLEFVPVITQVAVDLQAKYKIQGFLSFNSAESCAYCYHKADSIPNLKSKGKTNRFLYKEPLAELRHHQDTSNIMKSNCKKLGIREASPLLDLEFFDIINGFGIDDLHIVYEGVFSKILDLFYNKTNHQTDFHLNKTQQETIDRRIISMKPTKDLPTRPRSIVENLARLQGNEKRSLLFYFFPVAIEGVQKAKYVENIYKLSATIFMLSKKEVTNQEIAESEILLKQFIREYEDLYGVHNVIYKVHQLLHIPASVRQHGPLWTQSCFTFETNNGALVKRVKGTRSVISQIIQNYVVKQSIMKTSIKEDNNGIYLLGKEKQILLNDSYRTVIGLDSLKIHLRIIINMVTYSSTSYKNTSSTDYFVELSNNDIAKVHFYYIDGRTIFACVSTYRILSKKAHFIKIEESNNIKVIQVESIKKKLIYLSTKNTFSNRQYVTYVPNHFETS